MRAPRNISRALPLAGSILYVLVVYVLPIGTLIPLVGLNGGSGFGLLWSDPIYAAILLRTVEFAAKITLVTLVLAYPMAYIARTGGGFARYWILGISTIPLWISALVRNYAWLLILSRRGPVNAALAAVGLDPLELSHNTTGTMIVGVYILLPVMVLAIYSHMSNIDMSLVRAARTLGARPSQAFATVFLPQSIPGIIAGVMLVFITAVGFFITPVLLGGPHDVLFSMLISQQFEELSNFPVAAALSLVYLGVMILLILLFARIVGFDQLLGRRRDAGRGIAARPGLVRALTRLSLLIAWLDGRRSSRVARASYSLLLTVFLIAPIFLIIPISFSAESYLQFPPHHLSLRWYLEIFRGSQWLDAAAVSLEVGVIATMLSLVVAGLAALGLRGAGRRVTRCAIPLFIAPMMVPSMIYAVGAYYAGAQIGAIDTTLGIAVAHSALCIPYAFVVVSTGLAGIDRFVEPAARSLGAKPLTVVRRITLPILIPAFVIAAIMAFQTSFDEVIVALFLSGVNTRTLPRQLWDGATMEVSPGITAVAVLVVVSVLTLSVCGVFIARTLSRRRTPFKVPEYA